MKPVTPLNPSPRHLQAKTDASVPIRLLIPIPINGLGASELRRIFCSDEGSYVRYTPRSRVPRVAPYRRFFGNRDAIAQRSSPGLAVGSTDGRRRELVPRVKQRKRRNCFSAIKRWR